MLGLFGVGPTVSPQGGSGSIDLAASLVASANAAAIASLTLTLSSTVIDSSHLYYNGVGMSAAELLGWWDGSEIRPVSLLGCWSGSELTPVGPP